MTAVQTIGAAVTDLSTAFAAAGIESARLDARILVGHVLGLDPAQLFARANDPFPAACVPALEDAKRRRLAHEPVARVRGFREFYGRTFRLGPATLEPRPDSETLIDAALALRKRFPAERAIRILDLGTGTGCLLLTLIAEWPGSSGVGVDLAPAAIDVARANAVQLGLQDRAAFRVGDWCDGITERFDLIVANPPYISTPDLSTLAAEVSGFDPVLALDGGADGLSAYGRLIPQLPAHLVRDGQILLEVGLDQAAAVAQLCLRYGFTETAIHRDLSGVQRVIQASMTGPVTI
jgi:release factor glutamine methyltransferase